MIICSSTNSVQVLETSEGKHTKKRVFSYVICWSPSCLTLMSVKHTHTHTRVSAMDEISHTSIEQMYLLLWHKDMESSVYKDDISKIKKQPMLTAVSAGCLYTCFP